MALFKITKKNNCHTFKIRNSRALGGTSRVVLELKPFGISIRGLIGSEPWVGRSTGKMSRNSNVHSIWFLRDRAIRARTEILAKIRDTQY